MFYANINNIDILKNIINQLFKITTIVSLNILQDEINIYYYNDKHLIYSLIDKTEFNTYKYSTNLCIIFNIDELVSFLDKIVNNLDISLSDSNSISFKSNNQSINIKYSVSEYYYQIPYEDYPNEIEIDTKYIRSIFKKNLLINKLTVKSSNEQFKLEIVNDDITKLYILSPNESDNILNFNNRKIIKRCVKNMACYTKNVIENIYTLDSFKNIYNMSRLTENVLINMSEYVDRYDFMLNEETGSILYYFIRTNK